MAYKHKYSLEELLKTIAEIADHGKQTEPFHMLLDKKGAMHYFSRNTLNELWPLISKTMCEKIKAEIETVANQMKKDADKALEKLR